MMIKQMNSFKTYSTGSPITALLLPVKTHWFIVGWLLHLQCSLIHFALQQGGIYSC